MFKAITAILFIFVYFTYLCIGCATQIGNRLDPNSAIFYVGKTHKNEIAKILGLPAKIYKCTNRESEVWIYDDRPELYGYIIAEFTGVDPASRRITNNSFKTTSVSVKRSENEIKNDVTLFEFDCSGVLIRVSNSKTEGEGK